MKKSTRGASTAVSASLVYFYTTKKTSTTDVSQAGVTGFEPVFTVLETVALPLNYTPLCLSALQLQKVENLIETAVSIAKISNISKKEVTEMLDILYEEE